MNDTLVYGENPKETISSNNQTYQGHYIQSQHTKSIVFTCSSNKQLENKMQRIIAFIIISKNSKTLVLNLRKSID